MYFYEISNWYFKSQQYEKSLEKRPSNFSHSDDDDDRPSICVTDKIFAHKIYDSEKSATVKQIQLSGYRKF